MSNNGKHPGIDGIPPAILMYQNRQLSRLVRDLRHRMRRITDVSPNVHTTEVRDTSLMEEVESLRSDKSALYVRLEKLLMSTSHSPPSVNTHPQEIGESRIADVSPSKDQEGISTEVACELERLRTIIILGSAREADLQQKIESAALKLVQLSTDRDSWMNKCLAHEATISNMQSSYENRVQESLKVFQMVEKTFLDEVEKMAEEIAVQNQEVRQARERLSNLEVMHKLARDNHEINISCVPQECRVPSDPSNQDVVVQLQSALAKAQGIMRSKDEQFSRILSQHVQLQHSVTTMEQEASFLRMQLNVEALDKLRGEAASQLEIVRNTCDKFSEARNVLENHQDSDPQSIIVAREKAAKASESNQELEGLVKTLQTDNDALHKEIQGMKRAKTMCLPGSKESMSSLVEMELEDIKTQIRCSLCQRRNKSISLVTCMHCFCRECVEEQMLNARNRKCPLCNQRFADIDVREVHFLIR